MSLKNRKGEYERLKAAGKDVPEVLVKEFGDPAQHVEPDKPEEHTCIYKGRNPHCTICDKKKK